MGSLKRVNKLLDTLECTGDVAKYLIHCFRSFLEMYTLDRSYVLYFCYVSVLNRTQSRLCHTPYKWRLWSSCLSIFPTLSDSFWADSELGACLKPATAGGGTRGPITDSAYKVNQVKPFYIVSSYYTTYSKQTRTIRAKTMRACTKPCPG